jgi:SOS-response transcriptional repressor LexA
MAFTWDKDSNHSSLGKDVLWEHGPSTVSQQAFWLEVVGDSMTSPNGPSIGEGHLILVDPQLPAKNDCFVVAKFNNTRDITFKKLVIDARQTYLKPLNPDYRPTEFNNECQIIGVVVEAKYLF